MVHLHIKWSHIGVSELWSFHFLKIGFILPKSVDPDEIGHFICVFTVCSRTLLQVYSIESLSHGI